MPNMIHVGNRERELKLLLEHLSVPLQKLRMEAHSTLFTLGSVDSVIFLYAPDVAMVLRFRHPTRD